MEEAPHQPGQQPDQNDAGNGKSPHAKDIAWVQLAIRQQLKDKRGAENVESELRYRTRVYPDIFGEQVSRCRGDEDGQNVIGKQDKQVTQAI
jgi:hypothetical protein